MGQYKRISKRQYAGKTLHLTCGHCGAAFQYESPTGIKGPKYCSDFCRGRVRHVNAKAKPLCVTEGCRNHRHYVSGLCNSCYYRVGRTGTIERRKPAHRTLTTHGYVKVFDQNHPLSSRGHVYEHRKVLYDRLGAGPHACHWCGASVDWLKGCISGALVPDHLDGDKQNNALANLVAACNRCNSARGLFQAWAERHADDPWLWRLYEKHIASAKAAA